MIGTSEVMRTLYDAIDRVAATAGRLVVGRRRLAFGLDRRRELLLQLLEVLSLFSGGSIQLITC